MTLKSLAIAFAVIGTEATKLKQPSLGLAQVDGSDFWNTAKDVAETVGSAWLGSSSAASGFAQTEANDDLQELY